MRNRYPWVVGVLISLFVILAVCRNSAGAVTAIFIDEKEKSHSLDETLTNPFPAASAENKAFDDFLKVLKDYKLCPIIYDGDTTSSPSDLDKKIQGDIEKAKQEHLDKTKATTDAEEDFKKKKKEADDA